ncbi:CPBP family intramembrane metalloprotease [candidate division KSB1 bacterium]|nr:CPBP family intramembrane metalloprotease [candidate division KSB1 bacterium]
MNLISDRNKTRISALKPFFILIPAGMVTYGLRSISPLMDYARHLTWFLPLLGLGFSYLVFYFTFQKDKDQISRLGLTVSATQFTSSLIFGLTGGIFFFFAFFGAHPFRMFPSWSIFGYFNLFFVFHLLTNELFFRAWALRSFQTAFSKWKSIWLSAAAFTIFNLALVGQDLPSAVVGRVDIFQIVEVIFRAFTIGALLAMLYLRTRCIYGNMIFLLISSIPMQYEENGVVFQADLMTGIISGLCWLGFFIGYWRFSRRVTPKPVTDGVNHSGGNLT